MADTPIDAQLAAKPNLNKRWNTWVKQNGLLYFVFMVVIATTPSFFISASFNPTLGDYVGPSLLLGAEGCVIFCAVAAVVWASANKPMQFTALILLLVALVSTSLFFLFGPDEGRGFAISSSKWLMALRMFTIIPALVALLAAMTQAAQRRGWVTLGFAAFLALVLIASFYFSYVYYRNGINETTAYKYEDRASGYMAAKNYDAAIEVYSEAVNLQPYNYPDLSALAEARTGKGDYDGAIADYQLIIEHDRSIYYDQVYVSVGDIYSNTQRYSQALDAYSNSLAANPYHLSAYEKRGDLSARSGQKDKAIADYQTALKDDGVAHDMDGATVWEYLSADNRARIEQKIKDLGGTVPAVASPTP